MLRENESLNKENEKLKNDNASLLKNKDLAENQVMVLTRSMEALRKDLKDKEILVVLFDFHLPSDISNLLFLWILYWEFKPSGARSEAVTGAPKKRNQWLQI